MSNEIKPMLSITPWKMEHSAARESYVVKDATGYDVAVMLADHTIDQANARLIAAAPDMLRALQAIAVAIVCHDSQGGSLRKTINRENPLTVEAIEAAISKARGTL